MGGPYQLVAQEELLFGEQPILCLLAAQLYCEVPLAFKFVHTFKCTLSCDPTLRMQNFSTLTGVKSGCMDFGKQAFVVGLLIPSCAALHCYKKGIVAFIVFSTCTLCPPTLVFSSLRFFCIAQSGFLCVLNSSIACTDFKYLQFTASTTAVSARSRHEMRSSINVSCLFQPNICFFIQFPVLISLPRWACFYCSYSGKFADQLMSLKQKTAPDSRNVLEYYNINWKTTELCLYCPTCFVLPSNQATLCEVWCVLMNE